MATLPVARSAEFVSVNLPSVLFVFVHKIQIVKANCSLPWYSTSCYSALTLRRHISIISIQKSEYPHRDTVTTLQCLFLYIFISEIDGGPKFRWANGIWTSGYLILGLWLIFLSTGRYCLCGWLRSTDVLIYISLSDSNHTFRFAILLPWSTS